VRLELTGRRRKDIRGERLRGLDDPAKLSRDYYRLIV